MKRFVVFILFGLVLGTVYLFAQRKQVTEEYTKGTVLTIPYSMMPGKVTYGYVVSDDGKHVKDGLYNVKCSLVNVKYASSPYNITLNGNHILSANFLKGNLNGAISASYSLNFTAANRISTQKETFTSTFRGNFKDGIPHGNFIVNSKLETNQQLNVNYSNGILVGAYSCSVLDDEAFIKCKGTLNTKGELIGTWNLTNNYNPEGKSMQFQNNVLISKTQSGISTKPALVALARKYAAGSIRKNQLVAQGILVKEDSLTLGKYVRMLILNDEVVDLEDLGGYDFSISNTVKYEYLYEASFFTDKGFEKLLESLETNNRGEFLSYQSDEKKYGYIGIDKSLNMPYVEIHKNKRSKDLVTGDNDGYYVNVYITDEQMAVIDKKMYTVIMGRGNDLSSFINNTSYKDERTGIVYKINIRDWYKDNSLLDSINKIKIVRLGLSEIVNVKDIMEKATPYEDYDSLLLYRTYRGEYLIKKYSLAQVLEFEEKIKGRLLQMLSRYLPEPMVKYRKRYDIVDNASSDYFEISDLNDKDNWKNELYQRIEKLCPVVDCKIIDIGDNGEIVYEITKRISKKKNVIYRIPMQTKDGRIVVSSIDFNKATIVD